MKPTAPAWKPIGVPGYPVRAEDFSLLIHVRRVRVARGKVRVLN